MSGGLDSSIITHYAAKYYEKEKGDKLKTFSVDYVDNDKNFVKSDFQPNSDDYYIDIMKNELDIEHSKIYVDTPDLIDNLEEAMVQRGVPGMADVDSSLLVFCKNVGRTGWLYLGECADEIFGGYPWFFREDALNSGTFPWSIAIEERQELLHPDVSKRINLKEYIDNRYNESLAEVQILEGDSEETAKKREITHLTINWFMRKFII